MTKNTKTTPESSITTLHQAFDAYRAFIEHSSGVANAASKKQRLYVVARLREEHPDEPLAGLFLDRCDQLIDHWRIRPFGRANKRLSKSTSSKLLKELVRFLKWLDVSPASSWRLPRGFECLNRRVIDLPSDRKQLLQNDATVPVDRPVVEQWEATGNTLCFSSNILSMEDDAELEITNWHTRAYTIEEVASGLSFSDDDVLDESCWEICEGTVYRTSGQSMLFGNEAISRQCVPICDVSLLGAFFDSDGDGKAVEIRTRLLVENCCYMCKHCPEPEPDGENDDH